MCLIIINQRLHYGYYSNNSQRYCKLRSGSLITIISFQIMNHVKLIKILVVLTTATVILLLVFYLYNDNDDTNRSPFEGKNDLTFHNKLQILPQKEIVTI